jgi:uncharacterized protein
MNPIGGRTLVGHVAELRRYPVKSMQGESVTRAGVGVDGVEGDRRFAVIDVETGRVASAKNPRKWAGLLDHRAELRDGVLVVTAPDGTVFRSDRDDLGAELTRRFGRSVALHGSPLASAAIEIEWPDVPGLPNAGTRSLERLPAGGYFDLAPVHLLTTASLRRFRERVPECDFDTRRFRPNLVIETVPELTGFVEAAWVDRTLMIGEAALCVTSPCPRCVMTTLAQPDLTANPLVLRAAVMHGAGSVGMYANTDRQGEVAVGNCVWLE